MDGARELLACGSRARSPFSSVVNNDANKFMKRPTRDSFDTVVWPQTIDIAMSFERAVSYACAR